MSLPDFLLKLFQRKAQVLAWQWVLPDHVVDEQNNPVPVATPFEPKEDYVVLRLAEMYLMRARVLWREFYPVAHAFVEYGDVTARRSVASVAGPGQLKDLGSSNLDRFIGLSYRLAGPIVYDGQPIEMLAGLYAVSAADGAKVLIDTLSQLSGLIPSLKQATDIAGIVKAGAEGLLGLADTQLVLGVHDTPRYVKEGPPSVARPGFVVAVNSPQAMVSAQNLWVKAGRLYSGATPFAARPFDASDMMLFEWHRGASRAPSWATLPALAEHAKSFDAALRATPSDQLEKVIDDLYRKFDVDVTSNEDLSAPDKAIVRALVAEDLVERVGKIVSGGLFERRSVLGGEDQIALRSFRARDISEPPPGAPLPKRGEGLPLFG